VELDAGDCLFFHSNTLHKSNANTRSVRRPRHRPSTPALTYCLLACSPNRRWAFLCAYNRASNNALTEHHHAQYTQLDIVPSSAVMDCDVVTDMAGKDFLDPANDKTILAP